MFRMENYSNLTEFQKRAVELLAHKFIADYAAVTRKCAGEELEHFYEIWAQRTIADVSLRGIVWKKIIYSVLGKDLER